jgi:hypothetical protein
MYRAASIPVAASSHQTTRHFIYLQKSFRHRPSDDERNDVRKLNLKLIRSARSKLAPRGGETPKRATKISCFQSFPIKIIDEQLLSVSIFTGC